MFANGTLRGGTIAQVATSIAMSGAMFGLILHFQYAYGWSPVRAGLPFIVTLIVAAPLSEKLAGRLGHRVSCLIGAALLSGGTLGLAWGVEHGYAAIAVSMVVLTVGLRTLMTICAGGGRRDAGQQDLPRYRALVGLIAAAGAFSLTDSRVTDQ